VPSPSWRVPTEKEARYRGSVRTVVLTFACLLLIGASAAAGAGAPSKKRVVPAFRHVVVVVFENRERGEVATGPIFAGLAKRYAALTRYQAVAHPSLPNYLALVSGSTQGITDDCNDCVVDALSLADTLARAHKTWKTYAEGLPEPGWTGGDAGLYAKKHDPFLYFRHVVDDPAQAARVVPFPEFRKDVARGALPDFSLLVPDLCNDMHDCPAATGEAWLQTEDVPLLTRALSRDSAVFVVFDEGTSPVGGGGNVLSLVLGPLVRPGAVSNQLSSHYGLLRTIEDAWALPRLGLSAQASPITGIWRCRPKTGKKPTSRPPSVLPDCR
jgi:hypothetical protein